jgi:UMF1 family MFS transporter
MASVLLHRPVLAWALYDWANSAFATTVMAGFFPVFYNAISGSLSTQDAQFWFNVTLAAASLLVAATAPLLGAVADRGGTRKHLLALFTLLGVLMTAGLAWVHAGQWMLGLTLYALGTVGFSASNIFYDSMLTDVSREEDFDLVSAYGYGLGYVGGGLLFAVNVLMAQRPEWFGLCSPSRSCCSCGRPPPPIRRPPPRRCGRVWPSSGRPSGRSARCAWSCCSSGPTGSTSTGSIR